ncbi:MAG: methyl-accepting chemotaxis protein, partial [Leptolyngbya sp. SIO1D8]|nr:methyl-accepting chemotaxis protein [Leptolyngbya sp. SIO1D8]
MVSSVFSGLRKFKIQHQILLLVVLSAAIPASLVGLLGTVSASGSLSTNAESTLQKAVEDEINGIDDFLSGVSSDVLFLSKLPPVQGMIRAQANDGSDPEDDSTY